VRRLAPLAVALAVGLAAAAAPRDGQGQSIGLPSQKSGLPLEIRADQGIEWNRKSRVYIARGNARARQGRVELRADELSAYYRDGANGGTEIWRIDGDGNVRIDSNGQTAYGDKLVYDVDKAVLVLTGRNLRLVTPSERITARDSLEYWDARALVVARGAATVARGDRRLRADVLTAHFETGADGRNVLRRIDAFDNVHVSTPGEVVRASQGVYDIESGIATLTGSVKITRGKNQLNGEYAEVNLNTGVTRLFGGAKGGTRGYFSPRDFRRKSPRGARPPS
jgi:lipopolysaccharide export system protein LptA